MGTAISPTRVVAVWHQWTFHMSTTTIAVSAGSHSTTVWFCSHSCRPTLDMKRDCRVTGMASATPSASAAARTARIPSPGI